jgi:hypothetical protein
MQVESLSADRDSPEALVARLARQLRQHGLWDLLLMILPPLLAAAYCLATLYRVGWLSAAASVIALSAAAGLTLVPVVGFCRRQAPPTRIAAGLMDERAAASDRFITLSTIEPAAAPASMVSRLRAEAATFLARVQLRRDFPYRVKRSFYWSFFGSLVVALLFRLFLPLVDAAVNPPSAPERLRALAARMAERPRLSALARQLQALATKAENPKTAEEEKQAAVQRLQKEIAREQNQPGQNDADRDLLSDAASTLEAMKQQTGNGQPQEQSQNGGGGDVRSNVPQEGEQKASSSAGGGDAKGEGDAQPNKQSQSGEASRGEPKQQAAGADQRKEGEGKPERDDSSDSGRDKNQELAGKMQGDREDKGGKSKASEEIPQSPPPADRLSRPGEQGKEGIKGARYVTVQLPEEAMANGKGERGGTVDAKGNRVGQKQPASNVPLPAHLPDAPNEKQHVPLEYRGMIR